MLSYGLTFDFSYTVASCLVGTVLLSTPVNLILTLSKYEKADCQINLKSWEMWPEFHHLFDNVQKNALILAI